MKEELKAVCISWEKLRIPYNVFLFLATVACYLIAPHFLGAQVSDGIIEAKRNAFFIVALPVLALVANALFLLGPLLEFYLYFLGLNKKVFRVLSFLAGSVIGTILAGIFTLEYSHFTIYIEWVLSSQWYQLRYALRASLRDTLWPWRRLWRSQCRFASYRLVAYPPTAAIQLNVSRDIFP